MSDTLLRDFAKLKIEEQRIGKLVEEKKKVVFQEMLKRKVDEAFVKDAGTIVVEHKRVYSYPKEIQDLEAKLEKMKIVAEAKGYAKYTDNAFLKFLTLKKSTK